MLCMLEVSEGKRFEMITKNWHLCMDVSAFFYPVGACAGVRTSVGSASSSSSLKEDGEEDHGENGATVVMATNWLYTMN